MSLRIASVALCALAACGIQDASLTGGFGLSGSGSSANKSLDEPISSESDLSSNESALTIAHAHAPLCDTAVAEGRARCHARVRLDGQNQPFAASSPQGLGPADLRAAYNLPSSGGNGMTVAVVDAQDNPRAESDLAVYRSQFGLPPCTTANGCFKKVNESGSTTNLPAADRGWAGEISLDLQMVSAACPSCKIILVEADQASSDDLGTAENTAAQLNANAISNSWGGPESSQVSSMESQYFNHPGVFITASSGDNGYGASYPATSAHVTAVGGTSLSRTSGTARGWSEAAWSGAGSGCSSYVAKPSWQHDTSCSRRMMADVASVADPNTGVAIYDSYGSGGWTVAGGTSAAAPFIAAVFALTAKTSQTSQFSYANSNDFYDVTSGSNGSCSASYECRAAAGYDGPTGNGTPNGNAIAGGSAGSGGGTGGSGGGTGATGGGTGGGSAGTGGGSAGTGGGTTQPPPPPPPPPPSSSSTETEPNNSTSTANLLTANVTMVGSISSSSDVDYFRVSVTPGQTIDLTLSNLNADCDLRIYSSSNKLLAISDNNGTAAEEISGTVSNSIYYARVNGYNGVKCTGYQLTLEVQ